MENSLNTDFTISELPLHLGSVIDRQLSASLQEVLPQALNSHFVLGVYEENMLVGGLTASTSYGWVLIKTLWTEEVHRGRGIGKALMRQAEEKAKVLNCHSAWLDTSNPASKAFYLKLGYEVFGELSNAEQFDLSEHCRWFMKKLL